MFKSIEGLVGELMLFPDRSTDKLACNLYASNHWFCKRTGHSLDEKDVIVVEQKEGDEWLPVAGPFSIKGLMQLRNLSYEEMIQGFNEVIENLKKEHPGIELKIIDARIAFGETK
jgi:hypothetical protein